MNWKRQTCIYCGRNFNTSKGHKICYECFGKKQAQWRQARNNYKKNKNKKAKMIDFF